MPHAELPCRPEDWIRRIFASRAAAEGGVVRRKSADIDRFVGRARFLAELDRRGYRAVENGGQTIIFCNREPIRVLR
ncbi:N-(5'-phosphoribosyl)anthranilate isomerase [Thalassococcus sp. CAU 1522]|uniref:N-(5'-phosphoribosyl)anthranilate isomerase n=1 Tax=Thalassococcus arenae TaxID=2851652 RepID=A0ABS6NBH8_9RHOB|nr:N-(5'-phosphoribosyl)anthranilate isomerase [Thalassococcus arenae]MBV2361138.1 N-(5'-phosphoribosyl)anthranilate isomerase [Thalassococcus arenae]